MTTKKLRYQGQYLGIEDPQKLLNITLSEVIDHEETHEICMQCGVNPSSIKSSEDLNQPDLCPGCYQANIEWNNVRENLINAGHSNHCANRQYWGDGECSCDCGNDYYK